MKQEIFDEAIAELHAFIEDNAAQARAIVAQAPVSYNIENSSELYSEGWRVGFHRCLAELRRIADKTN